MRRNALKKTKKLTRNVRSITDAVQLAISNQARRQDSVTGGGGGAEMNFRGAREIYPSLDQINKVGSKKSKGFSGRNRKFKRFSGQKQVISKTKRKKKIFIPKTSQNLVSVRKKP